MIAVRAAAVRSTNDAADGARNVAHDGCHSATTSRSASVPLAFHRRISCYAALSGEALVFSRLAT